MLHLEHLEFGFYNDAQTDGMLLYLAYLITITVIALPDQCCFSVT
jgi:hypothetical protein